MFKRLDRGEPETFEEIIKMIARDIRKEIKNKTFLERIKWEFEGIKNAPKELLEVWQDLWSRVDWDSVTFRGEKLDASDDVKKLIAFCVLGFVVVSMPVLIPGHLILRAMGRNGFYYDNKITVDKKSFQRR